MSGDFGFQQGIGISGDGYEQLHELLVFGGIADACWSSAL